MNKFKETLLVSAILWVALGVLMASAARGAYQDQRLNAVATAVAGHPVVVSCATGVHEWAKFEDTAKYTFETDGFTYIGGASVIYLAPRICDTLEADLHAGPESAGAYWNGLAIKVLLHEASHQAGLVDESDAECNALKLVKKYAVETFGYKASVTRVTYVKVRDGHYKRVVKMVPNPALAQVQSWALYWHRLLPASYQVGC